MITILKACHGGTNRDIVTEYFRKLTDPTPLAPFEEIEDLNLRYVPATQGQMKLLGERISRFANGDRASWAFPPHPDPDSNIKTPAQVVPKVVSEATDKAQDPLWWRNMVVTLPRKGMKRDEYLKNPDTIGALYDKRHGNDDESDAARKRLFGLVNWTPEPREFKGKTYNPTEADLKCHAAIQAFWKWFQANHPEERL